MTHPGENTLPALEAVAEGVGATSIEPRLASLARPGLPAGPLIREAIGASVGALLPDQAIVINEALAKSLATRGPYLIEAVL